MTHLHPSSFYFFQPFFSGPSFSFSVFLPPSILLHHSCPYSCPQETIYFSSWLSSPRHHRLHSLHLLHHPLLWSCSNCPLLLLRLHRLLPHHLHRRPRDYDFYRCHLHPHHCPLHLHRYRHHHHLHLQLILPLGCSAFSCSFGIEGICDETG